MKIVATFNTHVFTFCFGYDKILCIVIHINRAETDITVNHDITFRSPEMFSDLTPHFLWQ